MTQRFLVLLATVSLAFVSCRDQDTSGPKHEEWHWSPLTSFAERALAMARDGEEVLVALEGRLVRSLDGGGGWSDVGAVGLPPGVVNFVHVLVASNGDPVYLAGVFGGSIYRSTDRGATFEELAWPPPPGLMSVFNPRARVAPFGGAGDENNLWLAGLGGIFHSQDGGNTFDEVDLFATGSMNVLFTDVGAQGTTLAAVSMLADSILPAEQQGTLTGVLFLSNDSGYTWIDGSFGAPFKSPTGTAVDGETVFVSTLDGGTFRLDNNTWSHIGGPNDGLAVAVNRGGVDVASASRGIWRYQAGVWTRSGDGPIVSIAGDLAIGHDGTVYRLEEGPGEIPPEPAGGKVHIALSFHVNLYHSYRGDTVDDDGFGMDLRVIRRVLDWLDEYPRVRADWDIENAFSVDGWLTDYAPDILSRIRERRERGQDGIRLMSWNNGAMAAKVRHEFDAAVLMGLESYNNAFGGYDPGVQPQECMITPEHLGWYSELGLEWITLFNSASSFTALRPEVELSGRSLYNPFLLRGSREEDGEMIAVPVYHHADVLSHGGLAAWTRQISDAYPGDSLLVIHMDGDAEVWEAFDSAIKEVYELDFVQFTTIQSYIDNHDPVESVVLHGDLADGMDDGFQSWSEKNINFEFFTRIITARRLLEIARTIAGSDPSVEERIADALEPMLLSLSTTHFGLASPNLHPDREESAIGHIENTEHAAGEALDAALAGLDLEQDEILVVNYRNSSGPALVELEIRVPSAEWNGPDGLMIFWAEGEEIPALIEIVDSDPEDSHISLVASVVITVESLETSLLRWSYDPSGLYTAAGQVDPEILEHAASLLHEPFTECRGLHESGVSTDVSEITFDDRNVSASRMMSYDLPLCGAAGTVTRRLSVFDGLGGFVVDVDATIGIPLRPLDAESIVLTPLHCSSNALEITWRTFGGTVRTRPARQNVGVWNGQAVDGWLALACENGKIHQVAHHTATRTSMAAYPLRNIGGTALLAPLGTLWSAPSWHDAYHHGGHPIGDAVVPVVGAQFRPSAPDWSGRNIRYRLLIGDGSVSADTLDLFAHPPVAVMAAP